MFRIYFDLTGKYEWSGDIEVEAETLGEVETIALLECRRRLASRYVLLLYIRDLTYAVQRGFKTMGKIKIRSL